MYVLPLLLSASIRGEQIAEDTRIVQINHLTNQKDADRLLLLKEVAGTKVYEERRAESTKIMDETSELTKIRSTFRFVSTILLRRSLTERLFRLHSHPDAKREKIKDLLTFIQERLDELEEEKEELKQYQVSILDLAFLGERYSLVISCHASICHRLMIEREDLSSIASTRGNSKIVQKH